MLVIPLLALLAAPDPAPSSPQPLPDCSDPVYRRLDFWVGTWDVFDTASGQRYASSRIAHIMNGCGISENYDAPQAPGGPYQGTSYTAFDRKDRRWHQLYFDVHGNMRLFAGEPDGDDLVLTAPVRDGALQRMRLHREADGSVRQIANISTDGGQTWQPGYDYTYRRTRPATRR